MKVAFWQATVASPGFLLAACRQMVSCEHGRPGCLEAYASGYQQGPESQGDTYGEDSRESDQLIVLGAGERPVHGKATDSLRISSMAPSS